ncbi:MAG: 30S ribosomal protein S4 [Chlamydiae bacterium RIFCSPHIGHO2_12_FULL_44_59]|nr:MAG: 30S ribosomal protein S4 [Chlamydiae bacterium RIFCSPHIGHO2_01_FULL_44_39]OGN57045.1 MAG: 30S ribosomal protein S4 [Chlamydiae bacterium RIFCSPHIGHO2_02_FULL_45_9]OGN60058.1 MAG: 30S ribosomal protein S4 [Chlamydiae bacterium RIFCSPHIGHO2_12_FULL_44_59]OGN66231.1 MAG: 30S ribosomal protein S4 [Chlamydiae bacterium RIFCSPLOWO2_01_FULL_44_52]OGN68503.1 MAG: 30S ribosomal protein S4 [Chlamydiae bacterium RIFCSPLOWO2_02_FULL_45_22]OGN70130.1 MAG: 30S ribosomal protein S4 [Chlamydiae bacter
MARYRGPKNRIARKFGANIFGKMRNPMLHKQHPPGMHGAKRKKKSDYGAQLDERQKLKAVYGMISQKQLVNAYRKAVEKTGHTPTLFIEQLECRLDNVVYRLRLAQTIFAAQQLVSHGHVLVNGKKVDRRSFLVKPGMTVSIKEASKKMKPILTSQETLNREVPEYLSLDGDKFSGKLLSSPQLDQIPLPLPINIPLVCEFISHTS